MPLFEVTAGDREAIRFGDAAMTAKQLTDAAEAIAAEISGHDRVAVWATARLETCVSVVGALLAGAAVIPINPKIGKSELKHVLADSRPRLLLLAKGEVAPAETSTIPRLTVVAGAVAAGGGARPQIGRDRSAEDPTLILYTSGTTGRPKGVVLPRRAIETNLAALADVWAWTPDDVLMHALPLFHAHGLVLGLLGPLRVGCRLVHLGRFSPDGIKAGLKDGATMMFGVPTMYHRLIEEMRDDEDFRESFTRARLIVSGSAPLPVRVQAEFQKLTGLQIHERYGLTETLMNTAVPAREDPRPGYVGPPLPGVELRLAVGDEDVLDQGGPDPIGEIYVRGPNVFLEYLNLPAATAEVFKDGWFKTGDMGIQSADGWLKIVGRHSLDLIKTAGYRVGAGEVEGALMEHHDVLEVAVTGDDDPDLGQKIVAWVVLREGATTDPEGLIDFVAKELTPHKLPREVRFLAALPRNELGKVQKAHLQRPHDENQVPRRGRA